MKGVFISYRQDDAKPYALLLRQDLVEAFGEENVFLDKDTLRAGSWREQIQAALDRSGVALIVIGRRWLTSADSRGQRRLDLPDDVHRHEIAVALSRKDVTVIPVTVDGAGIPLPEDLPADIRALTDQQARELSDNSARRTLDLNALIADIERTTGLVARGSERKSGRLQKSMRPALVMLGTLLVVAALAGAFLWSTNTDDGPAQLLEAIKPGAVRIESRGRFMGSGMFIDKGGAVLTTAFIAERLSPEDIGLKLSNGSRVRARIATINPAADLAFLRAEVTGSLTPLGLAPQLISQGDEVIAILQSADDEWLVTRGHVSRVAVNTAEFGEARIEVDIAEHLGSPVVNTRGEVIGVMQGSFKDRPDHTFLIPAHVIKATLGTGLVTPSQ